MQVHLKPYYCLNGSQVQQLTRNISPDPAVRYRRAWEQPGYVRPAEMNFIFDMPQQSPQPKITQVRHQDVVVGPACDRCASTHWMVNINPDADNLNWLSCIGAGCERRLVLPVEWAVVPAQPRP